MEKTMKNPINYSIHEALNARQSPYAFDPERKVSTDDLNSLFEAVRWTMSSYNAQPWRYIVGVRGSDDGVWKQLFDVLVEGNQVWAKNAPVLALGLVEHNFEHNGEPNKAAVHDLGAASASLTFEATVRGIAVHQMIGIDPEKACEMFGLNESIEPFTGLAIGYVDASDKTDTERVRKPSKDFILHGHTDVDWSKIDKS